MWISRPFVSIAQLLPQAERVALPDVMARDLSAFADKVDSDGDFNPKDIGLKGDIAVQTTLLRAIYGLSAA
jgi:hypothetical protein